MDNKEVKNIYNKTVKGRALGDYEYWRWFRNKIQKAGYEMTLASIRKHIGAINFSHCLELGQGQGTWTNELIKFCPKANFDLVDISKEMLKLAQHRFADKNNIRYFEEDFLEFRSDKKYDFFFSSRVIEYISDKELMVKKILDLLNYRAGGFIITKTPKYLRNKLLGRVIPRLHQGQIQPKGLVQLLKKYGADNIEIYPVTMSFPILRFSYLNKLLHRIFYKHKLNFISKFFAESYCIKFLKK